MRAPSSKILSLFGDTTDTLVFKASSGSHRLRASLLKLSSNVTCLDGLLNGIFTTWLYNCSKLYSNSVTVFQF